MPSGMQTSADPVLDSLLVGNDTSEVPAALLAVLYLTVQPYGTRTGSARVPPPALVIQPILDLVRIFSTFIRYLLNCTGSGLACFNRACCLYSEHACLTSISSTWITHPRNPRVVKWHDKLNFNHRVLPESAHHFLYLHKLPQVLPTPMTYTRPNSLIPRLRTNRSPWIHHR